MFSAEVTGNGRIPYVLRTPECVGEYLPLLESTGLVLANFLYEQGSRYRQTYAQALFKQICRGLTENNYMLMGLNKEAKIFDRTLLQSRVIAPQQRKSLPEMNKIEAIKDRHDENNDPWNRSATIFTDKMYADVLGLSERNSISITDIQ